MGKRYSILIGINDYTDCKDLSFCVKDAEDIAKTFVDFCNVESENVTIITSTKRKPNSDPWSTFCEAISNLKKEFQSGEDDIFFYFSGHGIRSKETSVIFKNRDTSISEINSKLEELVPKTKILIFDSCYSGKGYIESDKSAHFFSLSSKLTTGFYILCACSDNETAKETKELENGRFTHFLLSTIHDLRNYNPYGYLDVNSLFSKVDIFFKANPDLKQSPFQQIKSIGSYPIANNFNEELFYMRFVINDPFKFDWKEIVQTLNLYLSTKENIIGEFIRLVREHCDNTVAKGKGNASYQAIEISKNRVLLVDDGTFFDLFNPLENTIPGGGIKTAAEFRELFSNFYTYSLKEENGLNYYTFEFTNLGLKELCVLNIDMSSLMKLKDGNLIIDDKCPDYTIRFSKYVMMHSLIHMSIDNLAKESQRTGKIIYMEFHEGDRLLKDVESMIDAYGASKYIKTKTYAD
ncbi:MAG: caspase family protein [Chitinophagales bacterium]|nr:caspase family protein [Chitinophagales bacterium]